VSGVYDGANHLLDVALRPGVGGVGDAEEWPIPDDSERSPKVVDLVDTGS
jgi:hypothetical protein